MSQHVSQQDDERTITPVLLNRTEKYLLKELAAAGQTSMCQMMRILILEAAASGRLAGQARKE